MSTEFAPPPPFIYAPPADDDLQVVHEDAHLLAVVKQAGLLSVPGKSAAHADCLESRVRARFADARTVHRLDMDTSGIMVFARSAAAHRHLGLQFERRHLKKTYIARIWGAPNEDAGEIDLPLRCDWPNRPRQMVCFDHGKPALTRWRVLAREEGATRLLLQPETGRSHQLRVHCLALGHPIVGDRFYATGPARVAADRLQLHAEMLALRHPEGGAWIEFKALCPF